MIEFKEVYFSYPGQKCLFENFNVKIAPNQITVILGPNGCGKSTLLKLAGRLLVPDKGKILYKNKELSSYKRKEFAKEITILSQNHSLPEITVKELVSYGRYPYHKSMSGMGKKDIQCIETAMTKAYIAQYADRLLHHMSGGQCQRAFIAMALAQDTDVLLLDEPTNALDIHVGFEVMDLICELKKAGKTIVMVLHDLSCALQYADNILLLKDGKQECFGTPQEIMDSNALDHVFKINTHTLDLKDKKVYAFSSLKYNR